MIFESNKLSSRVNDATILINILSNINFVIYDKCFLFLTFRENPDVIEIISNICLEELDSKNNGYRQDILNLYVKNKSYFEKTYKILKSTFDSLKTEKEKTDYLLKAIIDNIYLDTLKSNLYLTSTLNASLEMQNFIKKNTYDCPIIVKTDNLSINNISLTKEGQILSSFILNKDSYADAKMPFLYFDKNYLLKNQSLKKNGIHFEKYVVFDFDRKNFSSFEKNSYGSLLIKNLNLSLFLGDKNTIIKNVVINPEIFKKIFPVGIAASEIESIKLNNDLKSILQNFSKFMSNIRVGLRLVFTDYREVPDGGLEKISNNLSFKKNVQVDDQYYTKAYYDVTKNKSILLLNKDKEKITERYKNIFLANVETSPFNFANFDIKKLHSFIDDKKTINDLTTKMSQNSQFITIFEQLIPIHKINSLFQMSVSASRQDLLNKYISGTLAAPNDQIKNSAAIAKIIRDSLSNSMDKIVINKGY